MTNASTTQTATPRPSGLQRTRKFAKDTSRYDALQAQANAQSRQLVPLSQATAVPDNYTLGDLVRANITKREEAKAGMKASDAKPGGFLSQKHQFKVGSKSVSQALAEKQRQATQQAKKAAKHAKRVQRNAPAKKAVKEVAHRYEGYIVNHTPEGAEDDGFYSTTHAVSPLQALTKFRQFFKDHKSVALTSGPGHESFTGHLLATEPLPG